MGIIRDGVFYSDKKPQVEEGNQNFKAWHHQMQRTDHLGDITQRYKQGKPNGEFIRLFPEEAKLQFSSKEIKEYGNRYGET